MTIIPDTKNWTWVIERACPECGLDAATIPFEEIPDRLRDNAAAWRRGLAEQADVRQRPRPDVWSPLEYACHVRDVCLIFRERLDLMLTRDNPLFGNWDQDATAVEQRYGEQEPAVVSADLVAAAEALADAFAAVPPDARGRTGVRDDGARFTVETFARYFIHDLVHHRHDVGW